MRVELIIAAVICGILSLVAYSAFRQSEESDGYRAACERIGGKPVWNGRNLECLPAGKTQ